MITAKREREAAHQAYVRSRDEARGAAAAHWRGTYDRVETIEDFVEDPGRERWVLWMRGSYASNPAFEFGMAVECGRVVDDGLERREYERRRRCAREG